MLVFIISMKRRSNVPHSIPVHTDDTLPLPVHEIALKRNLQVYFEVVREAGPPHMRTFLTKCIVGDFLTEGEGNGKKVR